ncbi:WhiB family transcriptional regulator [Streptomyces sp. NPDC008240]|uniref:WhiB family transcriptional regulator n=1 Tax=Streptomyces sp. NPDC008240 TaxID=3364822 RepID=UPI0036ECFB19
MNHYEGSVPATPRKLSWRDAAACASKKINPDIFHAGEREPAQAEQARTICNGCPVRAACLTDAYEQGDEWAIRGGLTNRQRLYYLRKNDGHVQRAVAEAVNDSTVLIRHIYQQHIRRDGVHVLWTDPRHFINVRSKPYTIHQLAFIALYGVSPVGQVQRMCEQEGCVGKACLTDRRMRDAVKQLAA